MALKITTPQNISSHHKFSIFSQFTDNATSRQVLTGMLVSDLMKYLILLL